VLPSSTARDAEEMIKIKDIVYNAEKKAFYRQVAISAATLEEFLLRNGHQKNSPEVVKAHNIRIAYTKKIQAIDKQFKGIM
jgi:hypothetical protein